MSLLEELRLRIDADGPISVADYMSEALLHPRLGYYATRDPLGQKGDFITAPEISQMFGELLGLCLAQSWMEQGAPAAFTLAELGPGRGTLMADMLRATRKLAGFAPDIVLVEASPTLKQIQMDTLKGHPVTWERSVDALPDQPLFLVANEFFDALPIRQFQRAGEAWREIRIGAGDTGLSPGLGQAQPQPVLAHRLEDTRDGDLVEICPSAAGILETVATRIDTRGGAALIIDYGDWRSLGDTLQALHRHEAVDPFENPGESDLTAHVDFEALARASSPAKHTRITPQGIFLERLGITERANDLANRMGDDTLEAHIAAHRRLTHPAEMGNLFKVMGLYPSTANPPPGLEP